MDYDDDDDLTNRSDYAPPEVFWVGLGLLAGVFVITALCCRLRQMYQQCSRQPVLPFVANRSRADNPTEPLLAQGGSIQVPDGALLPSFSSETKQRAPGARQAPASAASPLSAQRLSSQKKPRH